MRTAQSAGSVIRRAVLVRFGSAALAVVLVALAFAAPAAAKTTVFRFDYVSTGEIDASCGFAVVRDDVGTAMGRAKDDGRFDITNAGVATLTNPATGGFVTQKYQVLYKNGAGTTNPDGSVTFEAKVVGTSAIYAPDGTLLLRDRGPVTSRVTLMPTDQGPIFLSQEVIFEHGSHVGYCAALAG